MSSVVGTISYSVRSGLGILAREFIKNKVVDRILVIKHPRYEPQPYYTKEAFHEDDFLEGLTTLLLFENAFKRWDLVKKAKDRGIKVVMMQMYEYTPFPLPVPADLFIATSDLDQDTYESLYPGCNQVRINVPVDVPFSLRKKAEVFIHNAGHGGDGYRNGTPELLQAMTYVKSPIKLLIRAQPDAPQMKSLFARYPRIWKGGSLSGDKRIELILRNVPDDELYSKGDVFIFPEKFNGLSLPLQEAYASGMGIMCTYRFPMTRWLPKDMMIPFSQTKTRTIMVPIVEEISSPQEIARTIDEWYGKDISALSFSGKTWAEKNSWSVLKPKYDEVLR